MRIALFFLMLHIQRATFLHKKCCASNQNLKKVNSSYVCQNDNNKRLQIFTDETNFLEKGLEGTCFDKQNTIAQYTVGNHSIVETPISVNFFPKCCPLGYFYHTANHSCGPKENLNDGFITQNFVKVGLPDCRVLVDLDLEGQYRVELGKLYVGESLQFLEGTFCVDLDQEGRVVARGCYDHLEVCREVQCLHKCCPDGQSFVDGAKCEDTFVNGLDLAFTDRVNTTGSFAIIHNFHCSLYFLESKIPYYVDRNGELFVYYNNTKSYHRFGLESKSYCIEHIRKGSRNNFEFFMCFEEKPAHTKILLGRWAKIASCVFILITIAVYLLIPEMLNFFGKILVSYCVAILVMFGTLSYAQFERNLSDTSCLVLSFFFTYMSLVSFSWLNVMCFDIWCTFGKSKSMVSAQQKHNDLKKFLLYNFYGWGLPAVLTFLTFMCSHLVDIPYVIKPFLGGYRCFWEKRTGNYGKLVFYVIPLLLLETVNIALFLRTILYCLKVKKEINRMNDNKLSTKAKKKSYNIDKEQLLLILKLSVIMGILFVFEVVSSFFDFTQNQVTKYVEIIWDTINCLQGVFIFLIFICKAKVFRLCLQRFRATKDRKTSVVSLPTCSTQVSEPLTGAKLK